MALFANTPRIALVYALALTLFARRQTVEAFSPPVIPTNKNRLAAAATTTPTRVFYRSPNNAKEDTLTESSPRTTPSAQPTHNHHQGFNNTSFYQAPELWDKNSHHGKGSTAFEATTQASQIGFVSPQEYKKGNKSVEGIVPDLKHAQGYHYPFAWMMQGSALFIADHAGKTVVFHIPGELVESSANNKSLLQDIALCWLLGMKIVIVVAGRYNAAGECHTDACEIMHGAHECHNTIKVINDATIRKIQEEAGYLRCEMERKLNRCLRSGIMHDMPEGNVVSGNNFYTAKPLGVVRGQHLQNLGFCADTNVWSIRQVLKNNDVVLLNTVGVSDDGDVVQCNGYHMAAKVASDLGASKLIYMANEKSVMFNKDNNEPMDTTSSSDSSGGGQHIQELHLSFAKQILDHHKVKVHNTGYASFQKARDNLPGNAVELLLHLGWSVWALEHGVQRCHIVNPADGALLEEMFTSKNGANTCLVLDEELDEDESDKLIAQEDWDTLFDDEQGQGVAYY